MTTDLMKLLGDFPEINPSNYGDDDVNALNAWGIAAHTALEALGREVAELKLRAGNGYSRKIEELIAERDQARAELAAIRATDKDSGLVAVFAIAYWRACESSLPEDWLEAALTAQQILRSEKPASPKIGGV